MELSRTPGLTLFARGTAGSPPPASYAHTSVWKTASTSCVPLDAGNLTDSNPFDNGVMLAFLAWANNREFFALLGLKGPPFEALKRPPFEALGIKPANARSDAERQGVKVEFVGLD